MMRNKLLAVLVLLLCCFATANAQNRGNIIKYISENKLYRKGNDVTVTKLDLEWPVELEGNGMPALQEALCKDLLGVNSTSMEAGWREFHHNLGTQIEHMPDSVNRHFVNISLEQLCYVKGRYISFYMKKQETEQDGTQKSGIKKFFTYNIAGDKIISLDETFTDYIDEYNREAFEALLEDNAVCDEGDKPGIDLTKVPQDFAVIRGSMIMNLGGPVDHDDFSTVSMNYLYQLGLFKRGFVRWLEEKDKAKKKMSTFSPIDFDSSLSPDSVEFNISSLPVFPGGNDSLFSFLRKNTSYPVVDLTLHNEGRVTLQFIVEADGSLSDITVINPLTPSLDREAVRVVRLMPRWTPAEKDGVKVRTRITLPVTYRIG